MCKVNSSLTYCDTIIADFSDLPTPFYKIGINCCRFAMGTIIADFFSLPTVYIKFLTNF